MKGLPIGRARWFETKWEQLWVEAEMLACDYDFLVGVDSVAEYVVISGDAEEDSLLGRETEGLIGKLAAIFIVLSSDRVSCGYVIVFISLSVQSS